MLNSLRNFFYLTFLAMNACTLPARFVVYNFADIRDHKKFPSRKLEKSAQPFRFAEAETQLDPTLHLRDSDPGQPLSAFLKKTKTVAFLLIRRDTLLIERYFKGYDSSSVVPSFSVAKSFTSALVGCALADGLISSIDDPVVKYLPDWQNRGLESVTIRHLLQMTSGTRFNESYFNPFGHAARYYYGRHLRRYVSKTRPEVPPGTRFQYQSGNTQVLGMVLERVLKGKTLTAYLQEKIWSPMGMEFDASWSVDKKKNGMEKVFCCLNARARDFAKFGRLYLKGGNWNGRQILPESWCRQSTNADRTAGGAKFYQFQWWIGRNGLYWAEGLLGQFVMVDPQTETILVRLGSEDGVDWPRLGESLMQGVGRR